MARRRFGHEFRRSPDGGFIVDLTDWERELLEDLPRQLQELLQSNDPSLRRLFPAAYHADSDAERNAEYQRYMHEELLASRMAAADMLASTARAESLTAEQLEAWMSCVNAIRLVLGTQLDVSEESDLIDDDDPRAPVFGVYSWLGMILELCVEALHGESTMSFTAEDDA